MAPLPQSNTARLKVTYQNQLHSHVCLIRLASLSDAPDGEAAFQALTTALTSHFQFSEVTAVDFADEGSDIFLPLAGATLIGHEWGSGPANTVTDATQITFVGRSAGGRRVSTYLFGYGNSDDNFRITAAEDEPISNAIDVLQAAETAYVAIDGQQVSWKGYANLKTNDHWVKKGRA